MSYLSSNSGGPASDRTPLLSSSSAPSPVDDLQNAVNDVVTELERESGRRINDLDLNFVLKRLKKNEAIKSIFRKRRITDEQMSGNILGIIDEIIFLREGCGLSQLEPLQNESNRLFDELNPVTEIKDVPLTIFQKAAKSLDDGAKMVQSKFSFTEVGAKKKAYERIRNELQVLEEKRRALSMKSFTQKNFDYHGMVTDSITKLAGKYNNVETFCGTVEIRGRVISFELNIITSRNGNELNLSFPDEENEVSLENEVNIMNALLNYILNNVSVSNNVKIVNLEPKPKGCFKCGKGKNKCVILGGAKKNKRAKRSKKRNMRFSKTKKAHYKKKTRRS